MTSFAVSLLIHGALAAMLMAFPPATVALRRQAIVLVQRRTPAPTPKVRVPTDASPKWAARRSQEAFRGPARTAQHPRRRRQHAARPRSQPETTSARRTNVVAALDIQLEGTLTAHAGTGVVVRSGTRPSSGGAGSTLTSTSATGGGGGGSTGPAGVRPGTRMRYPRVIRRVKPAYPDDVRALGIEGEVLTVLHLDTTGRVVSVRLRRSLHPILDRAARAAARQMRFTPAWADGQRVATDIVYSFSFVLD